PFVPEVHDLARRVVVGGDAGGQRGEGLDDLLLGVVAAAEAERLVERLLPPVDDGELEPGREGEDGRGAGGDELAAEPGGLAGVEEVARRVHAPARPVARLVDGGGGARLPEVGGRVEPRHPAAHDGDARRAGGAARGAAPEARAESEPGGARTCELQE